MYQVALNGLEFKAYHGYYEEEREKGNHFEVDISVITDFEKAGNSDDLALAVNYEELYRIVKEEMSTSSRLLENVVLRIANRVLNEKPAVAQVKVSLAKLNPPIQGKCKEARVSIEKNRN